ncbi:MAG: hypothetical protein IT517_15790 [Burkholderiales bacterium]|nr:hypothetical protein [Burkholderiales bacterium]
MPAEMDAAEYQSGSRRLTEAERAQEAARQREAREREARAEAAREAAAAAARHAAEARRATRPPGERIFEAQCLGCHAEGAIAAHRHGWLGWWVVVLRMEWFNGAHFATGERSAIVAHLAASLPAAAFAVAREWTLALLAATVPLVVAGAMVRRHRRRARPGRECGR